MFTSTVFALVWLQLIASSAAAAVQSSDSPSLSNNSMASSSDMGNLGVYPVPRTPIQLKIFSTAAQRTISERNMLMCVIEAQDELAATLADAPIQGGKLAFQFGVVKIALKDLGVPSGRFTNDIAAWALRGLAEWMNNSERFRELTVAVYFRQVYVGKAMVMLVDGQATTANARTSTTEVSAVANAAASMTGGVQTS
ncbi:hypothetical protein N7G274_005446 [Stereocaulon virgatum]|uniref:Uncharacterized protein n=1 Tax=Stereocaulon virgatum TaxID=373712 RepID=A0ABR4A6Y3_9LECA